MGGPAMLKRLAVTPFEPPCAKRPTGKRLEDGPLSSL